MQWWTRERRRCRRTAGKFRQSTFCPPRLLDTGHYRSTWNVPHEGYTRSFVKRRYIVSPLKDRYYKRAILSGERGRGQVRKDTGCGIYPRRAHNSTENCCPTSTEGRATTYDGYLTRTDEPSQTIILFIAFSFEIETRRCGHITVFTTKVLLSISFFSFFFLFVV